MKQFLILFLLSTVISCGQAQKNKQLFFAADDEAIVYAGRVDDSDKESPSFCYPGVSIRTVFIGTDLSMVLEDFSAGGEATTNFYNVVIDGKVTEVLTIIPGKHTYKVASGLEQGKHAIEIVKRTECSVGKSTFYGFKAPAGTLLEKPMTFSHRIEFIGDSYTCGYGNEAKIAAPPKGNPETGFHSRKENHSLSYSSIVAHALNLEYRCVAYSGRGMYRNNTTSEEGTLPKIYTRIFPDEEDSPLWDLKKEIPDVVVIKLGANDFYPEVNGIELDDNAFIQTYLEFLASLRFYYPAARMVCLVGGDNITDDFPTGRKRQTRMHQAVQKVIQIRKEAGDFKVYCFNLSPQVPPYGEDYHATIASHQTMAKELIPFIQQLTGW